LPFILTVRKHADINMYASPPFIIEASVKQVTKKQSVEGEYIPIHWNHVIKCKVDYPVNSYIRESLIRSWSM